MNLEKCRSVLMSKGMSRAALIKEDECISGYIEYGGEIFSIAVYEYGDVGVIAAKIVPEPYSYICSEAPFDPRGFIAYADSYEALCIAIAEKIKRYFGIYKRDPG